MTKLSVEEMHCQKCVERIEKALNENELKFNVNLNDKTVTIDGCEHCVKTAIETLEDLGFSAVVMK